MANCQTRHPLRPSVSRHAHPMLDALPPSPFVQPVHFAHRPVTLRTCQDQDGFISLDEVYLVWSFRILTPS